MSIAERAAASPIRSGQINDWVRQAQAALRRAGADLVVDGEFGPRTTQAVRAFQARHGLASTGIVDLATATALDALAGQPPVSQPSVVKSAPWLATMRAISGTKEFPGGGDNPIIMHWRDVIAEKFPEYHDYCASYTHDVIPWCGLTAAYCLAANGVKPPSGFLWVDSWNHSAAMKHLPHAVPGCFLTFTRNGGGHIALMERDNGATFTIRGGNQSDQVNVVSKSKAQFTAALWPASVAVVAIDSGAPLAAPAAGKEV